MNLWLLHITTIQLTIFFCVYMLHQLPGLTIAMYSMKDGSKLSAGELSAISVTIFVLFIGAISISLGLLNIKKKASLSKMSRTVNARHWRLFTVCFQSTDSAIPHKQNCRSIEEVTICIPTIYMLLYY